MPLYNRSASVNSISLKSSFTAKRSNLVKSEDNLKFNINIIQPRKKNYIRNKMATVELVQAQDLDANCRLRNGLNSDCLLEIFEYLNQGDLLKLSGMNDHYKQLITNFVISKKTIEFSGNCTRTTSQLFRSIGRKLRHIKFVGDRVRFEHFVQQIVKHCTENQLKTVDITFIQSDSSESSCCCPKTITTINSQTSTEAATKYFRNVEEVSISHASESVSEILETLFGESKNIRILKLYKSKLNDHLLSWKSARKLTELHLIEPDVRNEDRFIEFIRSQSKLERFISHGGYYSIRKVGEALAVNCSSKLRVFCDSGSVHGNRTATDYDFISEFDNLKEVKLTSITRTSNDLCRPLMELARKSSIEKLGIYQNAEHLVDEVEAFGSIAEFKNLKYLEISVKNFAQRIDSMHLAFLFGNSGIIFKNVESLMLSGSKGFTSASKICGKVPHLKRLQINNLEQWHWLIESRRIVSHIAKIVERRNINNDEVTIVVNPKQWREFAIYKDKIIKLVNHGGPINTFDFKIGKTVEIPKIKYFI